MPERYPLIRLERLKALCHRPLVFVLLLAAAQTASALCGSGDEVALARRSAEKLESEWPVRPVADPASVYLQRLGSKLAPRQQWLNPREYFTSNWPSEWRFRAVRDLAPNAFSIGDGHSYVTDGAILAAASEAEVAAILAHEMGHQLAGHFCSNADGDALRGRSVGSLHQVIDPEREMEADRIAMEILSAAGFPPGAMLDVVEKMFANDPNAQRQRQQRKQELLRLLAGTPILRAPLSGAEFDAVRAYLRPR